MELLAPFIIPLICLRIVAGGLFTLWRPARMLQSELSKDQKDLHAPSSEPQTAHPTVSTLTESETNRRLRLIRWRSAGWIALGSLGLWASGFDLGWEWGKVQEWHGATS